ncbi:MAG: tetratricopeptide repeat protein [Hasllibacter sp.]
MLRYLPFVLALPAAAQECPPVPDTLAAEAAIISQVQAAPSQAIAQRLSGQLWGLWTQAPDGAAQELLDRGMFLIRAGDLAGAVERLDRLVDYCPDYAEGWNQRAFARFLQQDFAAALPDLDRALALRPRHTGALTGRAMTLIALGRTAEAQDDLRAALRLNPWLSERALLEGEAPAPEIDL